MPDASALNLATLQHQNKQSIQTSSSTNKAKTEAFPTFPRNLQFHTSLDYIHQVIGIWYLLRLTQVQSTLPVEFYKFKVQLQQSSAFISQCCESCKSINCATTQRNERVRKRINVPKFLHGSRCGTRCIPCREFHVEDLRPVHKLAQESSNCMPVRCFSAFCDSCECTPETVRSTEQVGY